MTIRETIYVNGKSYKAGRPPPPEGLTTHEYMAWLASLRGPYVPYKRKCERCNSYNRKDRYTKEVYCPKCYWDDKRKAAKEQPSEFKPKVRIAKI